MSSDYIILSADRDYWTRREAQERLAAQTSADPAAQRVHATLAERYAARLRDAEPAVA